jgi:hypothetical protein
MAAFSFISGTFVCSRCGKTYEKGWSDADMLREMNRNFPGLKLSEARIVCDPCWRKSRPISEIPAALILSR